MQSLLLNDLWMTALGEIGGAARIIAGDAVGAAGAAGSIYEGYVLAAGDDFNLMPSRWDGQNMAAEYSAGYLWVSHRRSGGNLDTFYIDPSYRGVRSESPTPLGVEPISIQDSFARLNIFEPEPSLIPFLPTYANPSYPDNRPVLLGANLTTTNFRFNAAADHIIECRYRLAPNYPGGFWPAFWYVNGDWPRTGEVDVVEIVQRDGWIYRAKFNVMTGNGVFQDISELEVPADTWIRAVSRRISDTIEFWDDSHDPGGPLTMKASTTSLSGIYGSHAVILNVNADRNWRSSALDLADYPSYIDFDYWRAWLPASAGSHSVDARILPPIRRSAGEAWDTVLPSAASLYGSEPGYEEHQRAGASLDSPGAEEVERFPPRAASMNVDLTTRQVSGTIPDTSAGTMALSLFYAYDDGRPSTVVFQPYHIAPIIEDDVQFAEYLAGEEVDEAIPFTMFHSGDLGPHTYQVEAPGLSVSGNGTTEVTLSGPAPAGGTTVTITAVNVVGQETTVMRDLIATGAAISVSGSVATFASQPVVTGNLVTGF